MAAVPGGWTAGQEERVDGVPDSGDNGDSGDSVQHTLLDLVELSNILYRLPPEKV